MLASHNLVVVDPRGQLIHCHFVHGRLERPCQTSISSTLKDGNTTSSLCALAGFFDGVNSHPFQVYSAYMGYFQLHNVPWYVPIAIIVHAHLQRKPEQARPVLGTPLRYL